MAGTNDDGVSDFSGVWEGEGGGVSDEGGEEGRDGRGEGGHERWSCGSGIAASGGGCMGEEAAIGEKCASLVGVVVRSQVGEDEGANFLGKDF